MPRYAFPVVEVVAGEKREVAVGFLKSLFDLDALTTIVDIVDPEGVVTISNQRINTQEIKLRTPCDGDVAHRIGTAVVFDATDFVRGKQHEVLVTVENTKGERLVDTVVLEEVEFSRC